MFIFQSFIVFILLYRYFPYSRHFYKHQMNSLQDWCMVFSGVPDPPLNFRSHMGKISLVSPLNIDIPWIFSHPPTFHPARGTRDSTKLKSRWHNTIMMWDTHLSKKQTKRQRDWHITKLVTWFQIIWNSLIKIVVILITERIKE